MSLKARAVCGAAAVAAVLAVAAAPEIAVRSVRTVEYVEAEASEIQLTASCSGEIKSESRRELYLTSPVYVDELYVTVGDEVEKGDALFRVDRELTQSVLSQSYIQQSDEAPQLGEYAEYLERYGIDAAEVLAMGGSTVSEKLENIPQLVCSPFSGVVTELNLGENRMCVSSSPLVALEDGRSCYALLGINERYASELDEGALVELKSSATGDTVIPAHIRRIYPAAKKVLNGLSVETLVCFEAQPDDAQTRLLPGGTAEAIVLLGEPCRCITLPYGCILQDDGGEYVFLIRGGRAEKTYIETLREFPYRVEVSGISEGEMVISRPDGVRDGMRIYRSAPVKYAEDKV